MNRLVVYNACVAIGVTAAGTGSWIQFGPGVGLMTAGGLIIGLTILAAAQA